MLEKKSHSLQSGNLPPASCGYWSLIWLHFPSKSSPEKEAFKKRAKLQAENSEETDENEPEEVRTALAFRGLTSMSSLGSRLYQCYWGWGRELPLVDP